MEKINEINPDVIITEGFFQWTPWIQLWAFFHHIPVFMGYERTLHTERNNSKLKTWLRKIQNKFIKGYLVNGSETRKYLESIGVAPTKIFIGGMSADSKGLKESIATFPQSERNSFRLKYKRGNNGIIYLFSGRVEKLKGTPQLLAAWEQHIKKYPDDSIVLIGYGESYDVLKEKYKMDKSIFLEGRINYDEVYKYYAIADVFILPTLQDNWSLVIPEAMSCGLPVATSIYNGCYSELVHKDKNGITFDTLDQESIIQALDYFHHHDLKEMGHQSVLLEKPFSTENCAKREYEAIINNI